MYTLALKSQVVDALYKYFLPYHTFTLLSELEAIVFSASATREEGLVGKVKIREDRNDWESWLVVQELLGFEFAY